VEPTEIGSLFLLDGRVAGGMLLPISSRQPARYIARAPAQGVIHTETGLVIVDALSTQQMAELQDRRNLQKDWNSGNGWQTELTKMID
jgi:hypothetical protein